MRFLNVKWQMIDADNSCPGYIGIYSQVGLVLYNLSGSQALIPNCLGKYPTMYIDHTHKY